MKRAKKLLGLVLAVLMLVSVVPMGASAESQRDAIVRIALAEEGTSGCPNKYTYAYGQIGGTYNWGWCAAFIYWCAQQAGIPHSIIGRTASANVNSFNTPYYSYSSSSNVQKGDILYLTNNYGNHVGLVYNVDSTYIYTIEGNMGNAVKKYKYRRSDGYITWSSSSEWQRITHYGVPNYSGSHSHSYLSHYEADHPHRVYKKCSCGDWYYTGETKYLSSCSACNEPTKIIYPTNGGIYKIASGVGNNMYFVFALSNDNVQIFEDGDSNSDPSWVKSQYFKLTHVGDGWYTIVNVGNGKAVDVDGGNSASGTNIKQWTLDGNPAQLYRFYDAGNGYCYIKSKLGCYVDVQNGDNVNRANVWTYTFNGTNAQKWKLVKKDVPGTHTHSYTSTITTQPTCKTDGIRTYKCTCGASYTQKIARTSHNSNTIIPAVSATCTKTGLTEGKKCSVCGTVTTAQQTVAKKAHSYTSSVTTQPTCTKEGIRTYKCSTCTASYTETIAKKAHTVVTVNVVAPTCTKTGLTEGKRCSVCGTVTTAQQTIPATGHTDTNGDYKCDYGCGYEYEKPADPAPSDPSENCGCNCHKGGIAGFFFKIILFFQKLFKKNAVCACGVAHY